VLRISLRAGVVRRFSASFQAVVVRHHWYEPRARFKALLRDDPRWVQEPEPCVYRKARKKRRKRAG
jgi:hypothetical protein